MAQTVQMTTEQLQQLIEAVRVSSSGANDSEGHRAKTTKGSFSNCSHRFGGERDHEVVEEFITSIVTYKEIEAISDDDALKGLSLLFYGLASTWWQGVRKEAKAWNEAIALIREHFSPAKPAYQIYMEIFERKQSLGTPIDTFVCQKRALLAQLPDGRHDQETELDLIYGLLHIKYRKHIARHDIKSFRDLLERGRIIEHNQEQLQEQEPGNDCAAAAAGAMDSDFERSRYRERGHRAPKRCTHCNYRGHTYEQCRKRKQPETNDNALDH